MNLSSLQHQTNNHTKITLLLKPGDDPTQPIEVMHGLRQGKVYFLRQAAIKCTNQEMLK
jgi:hypothetical protein